ncbi:hypothetical protein [Sphingobium sp. CAP-1]|uniref:hypothetical protein n=1 Tax=Sphingobium sp. CAP-1 TaxID=2676077 RepID=UPI0018AD17C2|nr:hypothetical protein [Sphingobium sp. CAP-1]
MQMTNQFDRAYFTERLEKNRILAEQTNDPNIRDLHLEYVRLYEQLIGETLPA